MSGGQPPRQEMSTYTVSNWVGSMRRPDESTLELLSPSTPVTLQPDNGYTAAPLRTTLKPWLCSALIVSWALPKPDGAAAADPSVLAVSAPRATTEVVNECFMYGVSDGGYSRRCRALRH